MEVHKTDCVNLYNTIASTYGNKITNCLILLYEKLFSQLHTHIAGIVNEGPSNVTYIPGQTPLPIELTCNITGFPFWRVNGTLHTVGNLRAGILEGHNISGSNILINVPVNDTEYICISSVLNSDDVTSPPAFLIIAGECL